MHCTLTVGYWDTAHFKVDQIPNIAAFNLSLHIKTLEHWITLGLYSLTWLPGAVVRAAGLQLQGPELHALRHAGRHVLAPLYGVVSAQLEYVDVVDMVDMVDMVDISSV